MEDKLLGLYNDFKNAGLFKDTKDYGTFRQRMQGQGYQAQIYKVAKQNGADVGQFWQFQRNFGLGRWAGGSRQPVQPTKPLTTAQRANMVAQEYKKKLQQKSGAYKEGANFVQANGYEGESLGDLIGDAWEGVKSVGRKVGDYFDNIGQGIKTTTSTGVAPSRQVDPTFGAKPSASNNQVVKNCELLHKKNSQMTPLERSRAAHIRSGMQGANAFGGKLQQFNTPEALMARAKQQHEDDINQMAYQGVGQNLGKDIFAMTDKAIDLAEQSSKDFFKGAEDALGFSQQYDPRIQKSISDAADMRKSTETIQQGLQVGLADKVQEYFSRPEIQKNVMDTAEKMNISLEEAVQKYYMPNLIQYAKDAVEQRQLEKVLPQGFFDYLGKNLSNSVIGMITSNALYSKEERQRRQRALAISEGMEEAPRMVGHNTDYYKAGILSRAAGTGVNMLADSPIFGAGGTAADMAVNTGSRILARGLEKVGLKAIGKVLTPREMAFKAANMSMAQKMMSGLTTGTAKSALNLGGYSSITGGLQQISTGEDSSPAAVAMAAITSGWHGAKTGAMFGFSGGVMHPWASRYGITGLERNAEQRFIHGAQKVGATAASVGVEAGTMMVADHLQDDKEMSFAQWLEDGVTVMAFKLGEPRNYKHVGSILHGLTHNTSKTPITLTKDEKSELINSVSGKNLMDAFVKVDRASKTAPRDPMYKTAYTDFMKDPEVSRSTKEKVNAALGMPSQNYKISQRSVNDVKNKQILEYASDGTLLTRTSYKNAEERRDILYRQKADRDNMYILNLVGIAKLRGRQLVDDNGKVSRVAADFLQDKGYDISKDPTDPKNAELIANLQNPNHELYLDWIKYADERNQFTGVDTSINKILEKQPLKRTDEEVTKLKEYAKSLETQLFPDNKLHTEESRNQGRRAAENNNLGTEQPNGEAVKQGLDGLRQAENNFEAAYESNDVLKIGLNKLAEDMGAKPKADGLVDVLNALHGKGLTNPQIYGILADPSGKYIVSEEQLTPFAQYINANARVQGMQQATADAIEENVKSFVSDWSYHGTLNGKAMNGEQALYVQDSNGRTLLVGSGDVAFDQTTGRAKEGSGDMLVCFDPNTKEMVYVKADEVTFFQNQPIDQFAAEYRQRLQMKNSEPYNQAAQEQAMQDAAKPQQEQEAPQDNTTKSEDSTTKSGENGKDDTTSDTTSGKDNTTNEDLVPQEQPQQTRKFADGTEVPMTTDSKGRPTPDYEKMTPEQSAEILTEDFGENAEKVVDGQIKKAENALKDAEKMKVDYTAEPNDIMEQEALKNQTIEAAKKQLDHAQNIKKAMTAKKVAETVGKTEQTDGAHEAGSVAAQKFVNAPRLVGNKRTRMLPDGETKIKGHYEIVPAESLTPSHDVNNNYKKSEGFPTDAEGRTVNDRDYEHDKAAQQNTDQIARKYNGMAIEQVPVVSDEGIVYDGNGRTMAGQKAAKDGTDGEYINDLLENAENFGFTREQIEQSGIEHPRLVMVTDERLPYDTATFSKFNRNEKKTQSNTEQAVAKAKTLTSDEVGAIVAEIEGNGSLDAFFNNSKAINDLVKTLVDKGIIGQNEVAQMMDSPERLSAQGREYVKNLLLGSIFKPETIRMLGIDSTVKNKAINAIRSVMDNMKLGEFSLRDEIDQAIQLLYEARQGGNKVDTLLRTPDMYVEDAAKRYPSISQMMALALEGKVADFRDLLDEYNRIAAARNTGEGSIFEATPTKEELINEYLNFKKWQDYGTGHSENEGGNDVSGVEKPQQEASGGNEPAEAGSEPERPRVEEPDDLVNKELESRIEVTDEETETPSKNGPIMKQKILIDGDKEVIKVDEPNEKGEYTGSYYEYDGKKYGDLNEVVEHIDEVTSSDGEVKVKRIDNNRGNFYELRVPKSKAKGGKYFLDNDLLKLVDGNNFETRGNNMLAEFKPEQLKPVLDRLSKMGVKVQEERKTSEDEGTHFREDRGLLYSKTDTKDVKKGRIIPEDVDKTVSSQIEKKFDDEINRLFTHVTPNIRRWANAAIDLYSKDQTLNSWEVDENKNVTLSEGLNTVIDDLTKKINEYETKYGIRKDANIGELVNSILRKINSDGSGSGRNTSDKGQQEGTGGETNTLQGGGGERRALDILNDYKALSIRKAAAERAKAYILARSKSLQETYGLKRDEPVSYETIDRIFNDYNSDPEVKELYDSIVNCLRSIGTEFYVGSIELARTKGYYKHSENFIKLNVDRLSAAGYTKQDLASTLCHEMLHPLTSDIIAMYQKGHTDKLSPSQIEAAKDAVDIYNELIKMQKESKLGDYYGLENPREMITELASPEWRSALRKIPAAKKWYQKLINAICRMIGKDPKYNKLGEMERTLTNLLDNFGKEQFDFASQNENELFKDEYQGYKVTDKDELDSLNKEKTFRMYSGMQEVDGKLYSPMAAIIDGKRTDATEIGAWMGADERPDLVKNGKFTLVKTDKNKGVGEGDVPAAYNPYMHTSTSMMNDQFTGAYARGNIKVVEWEIPESEKTSGYHAEGAKDAVGLVPWHSGSVNSLLPKDRQRQVMLSRWRKAVRVVPDSEVAESIAEQLKGTGLAIPWNVVTPNQVRELAKLGVPITTVESGRQAPETKEKFLQQMVELEQEFPQAKFVNVKMTKDAYKEWGKNGGTKFREDYGNGNYPASPASSVESHVEKVSKNTGAKVNMVSSVDEITNKAAKAAIEEGRKITGWYDEKTGEVHLYMPNIHDRYTAEKTIWHEVVGHKGMRELFGDERFDKFLRDVWYDLDKPENAALKKLVDEERKFNPLNIYDAIEEGIARLAEDGKGEPGFWNGIKNKVSDFLHEIGYRIAPNTKDVKYLLWLSKNLQKNPDDPYWKMRAEAVKYRLDHDRVPAVVAHDGMFYGNDGKVRSMESMTKSEWNDATDGQIHFRTTPSAGTALDRYHRSLDEHGYMFTESYMDNMLSLKKLMNAIVPDKKIEDIASSENPYMLQNTMQGAMSDAAQMFERNVMKPLDKAMADVLDAFDGKKDDEKIRNFNLYMITKHGLERNREFFVRDFLKQMRMDEQKKQDADFLENSYYSDKEYLDNELKAGNIDLKEYYRQLDESIRNHFDADFEAGDHDYSGMHAIQEVAKSSDPYDDAEAIQSVMDSEAKMESIKKGAVKDYWDKVKAATQYSIDSDYKNGIISKELHGHVSNMFNWYVPLRKYDEATAEDTYGYITEQGDPKSYIGSTIMRARGHKYLSETNVLAQIGAMGNRAIKNGGMNAIRQAFARFARNNSGNNLITETSVWYEKDPVVNIVYERYPDIPEDATADEINQIVSDFNKDMKMKESQGLAYKVYRRDKIGYKFQRAENKSQHIVDVKIAGRTHTFIINGNPRAAQALNGLLEHKNDSLAGRVTASISRKMAQLCTSYNPEFVMRNMIKDFEFASTNLLAKEGLVYTKRFEQYYAKVGIIEGIRNSKLKDFADTGGFGLYAKYRNGTLDTTNKLHRYFKEFMENGGETGWVQIKNMEDFTKEYKLHIKGERKKVQKVGKGIYNAIFKNLENVNEIAENLARFATYCASRDSNRSVIRSVYDAKEVSTNFNRHGSGNAVYSFKNGEMGTGKTVRKNIYGFTAAWFRNSSMFFNAGIQSTNLLIKNFKNNKSGTIGYIASAPFISGMAMALLNNFIISNEDEKDRNGVKDPYAELPDYIRRNNLCIYIGGGEFVTIPLAIEERAFYGLGDFAAGMTFSKNISSQKMSNLTENKNIDKYLNPFMDAVGCMSQLVPVADYLGNASFGKHPVQETIKAVAPSATSPFLEWVYNSDWKGAPIQRDNKFDENQPSWMLAYKGTPEWMINMNKKVNALTNDVVPGNEDMKGNDFLDEVTNPSALHHFYGSYFGGAATFVERVGGLIKNGKDTETKDIPFLRSFLYTPNEQSSLQRTKSKWYNYKDEMEKTMANVDRLKSKNVPLDKRITNIGEYYQFQNSKEAAKVRVIELAEKQMKRWKKMRDKASDTESINFANQNIDRIMMDAVDDLDKLN